MKVVILCGGQGTRLREFTERIPKPMVEIGGRPILWHIMKLYAHYGYHEFVLCLGYRGEAIREYFHNYSQMHADATVNLGTGETVMHGTHGESHWKVTLADTGLYTAKGARLQRVERYLDGDTFMFTYGDGVADVNIAKLVETHRNHGKLVTFTGIRPRSRWATVDEDEHGNIINWAEKRRLHSYINGGYFVVNRQALGYVDGNQEFEEEPMERLAHEGQARMYRHEGFWECMDNYRDFTYLDGLYQQGKAEWMVWQKQGNPT